MKPLIARLSPSASFLLGSLPALIIFMVGCTSQAIRTQSPEERIPADSSTKLIGEIASEYGTTWVRVEGVGLVTGLDRTGSDPNASPARAALISEMQKRGVPNPNQILSDPHNSLVVVSALIPPGAQKGDHVDLTVRLPSQSTTTSLRDGYLMQVRLIEVAMLDGQLHEGKEWALGEGSVLVDPTANNSTDASLLTQGMIPGGGVEVKENRTLGLILHQDHKSFSNSSLINAALNKRFSMMSHGIKQGIASAKRDEYVEITVLPRYKHNLARYMRVIRSVALKETEIGRQQRLRILEQQLLDPVSASDAALKLEAIGTDAIKHLNKGLESSDPEVRFYAAEALAYLDQASAVPVLIEAARNDSVFRAWAFTALSSMEEASAFDSLRELFDLPSAETRYGAFRAMVAIHEKAPLIRGENLAGKFSYHLLNSNAPPLVHVTKSFRPEIVLFGPEQMMKPPFSLEAGNKIMVKGERDGQVTISRFSADEADQKRVVSLRLDEVIRAIVDLGGTYPDVVQMLQQAKSHKALEGRFEVDALPDQSRLYDRLIDEITDKEKSAGRSKGVSVASPLGELFGRSGSTSNGDHTPPADDKKKSSNSENSSTN